MLVRAVLGFALFAAVATSSTVGQTQGLVMGNCAHLEDLDHDIAACSAVINDPTTVPGAKLAAYVGRGEAYRRKGQHDLANDDLQRAVRLDGQYKEHFAAALKPMAFVFDAAKNRIFAEGSFEVDTVNGFMLSATSRAAVRERL
jgi:hypothetical protein